MKQIKLSSLSKVLQDQIKQEWACTAKLYTTSNLPVLAHKILKGLVKDYLLTTNLNLTAEEEAGISRGEYAGIFVKSSPARRYEVLLVKSKHLARVRKALLSYIETEKAKDTFEDKETHSSALNSIAATIPLKGRILCTRQGVNFLAKYYTPLNTNLGRK